MFQFFANIFGYLLNFTNNIVGNYGLAIILFTVVIKIIMLPLSIKQQKSMKKNAKFQEEMKVIQFKYKNDPEKLNRETMELYKKENMSPMGGCLTALIQFILLISIFNMVRLPLTYITKIDKDKIDNYVQVMQQNNLSVGNYPEMSIIREKDKLKELLPEDNDLDKIHFNMQFCGLDLGKIPQENLKDWTVYIIPILYILSTFVSMKMTTAMQKKDDEKYNKGVIDITEKKKNKDSEEQENTELLNPEDKEKEDMEEAMQQSNKMMAWMMPIMAVSVSIAAPLGLALYWLTNNILMICERIVLDKVVKE